jgi:signal transduction histidine kinase
MSITTASLSIEAVEARRFAELVNDFVGVLDARRRSSGEGDAAATRLDQVSPGEAEKLSEIIDWLALAVERRSRATCSRASAPAWPMRADADPRDRFLGMLAHDLQTPLHTIMLTAGAELRQSEGRQQSAAARVLRCAERMRRMIADLLDFARIRSGTGLPVRPEPIDLGALAREVAEEVEESNPGARVRLDVDAEVLGEWDRPRLAQVLSNLMSNAIHHGRPGADVRVRLTRRGAVVGMDIVNEGDPIPDCDVARLFEPFERGHSARARPESVGLGLFIVREILVAHGGEVVVFNSPGGDDANGHAATVTFSVALPLRSALRA